MTTDEPRKPPTINWVQVIAAALAAMSSAVLLSTLGVAGTIIGAAVGSVTASVAGALYTRGLDVSRQQVAGQAAAIKRLGRARNQLDEAVAAVGRGDAAATRLSDAERELDAARNALEDLERQPAAEPATEPRTGLGWARWRRLPWKYVVAVAVGVFVLVMVAITVVELATGRAISTYTGGSDRDTGSTVPGVSRGEDADEPPPTEQDEQGEPGDPDPQPTPDPTEEPAEPTEPPTEVPDPEPTVEEPAPETIG